jgi:hypothetical protein
MRDRSENERQAKRNSAQNAMNNGFVLRTGGDSCSPNVLQRQQPVQRRTEMPAKIAARLISTMMYSGRILPYASSHKNKLQEQIPNPTPIPRASLRQSWRHQYLPAGIQARTNEKPIKMGMKIEMTKYTEVILFRLQKQEAVTKILHHRQPVLPKGDGNTRTVSEIAEQDTPVKCVFHN